MVTHQLVVSLLDFQVIQTLHLWSFKNKLYIYNVLLTTLAHLKILLYSYHAFSFRYMCMHAELCFYFLNKWYIFDLCISVSVSLSIFFLLLFSHYPLTLLDSDLNVSLILAPACRQGCPTMIVLIWQELTYTWFNPSCLYRVCCGTSLFRRLGQGLVTAAVSPLCNCMCEKK